MKNFFKKLFDYHSSRGKQNNILASKNASELWCVIENIKKEVPYGPGGKQIKSGLKKYKAGAKVHIISAFYGGCERIVVIGQHRNSGKYISCIISVKSVENLRVKKIYSKKILKLLEKSSNYNNGESAFPTKKEAEELASVIPIWAKE